MSELSSYIIKDMGAKVTDLYKQGVIDGVKHINKAFISAGVKNATIDDINEICKSFIESIKDNKIDINSVGDDLEPTESNSNTQSSSEFDDTPISTSQNTENVNGVDIPNEETCKQNGMSGDAFSALLNSMSNPVQENPDIVDTVDPDTIDVPSEDVTDIINDN